MTTNFLYNNGKGYSLSTGDPQKLYGHQSTHSVLREALTTEVNSALLTFHNHNNDNSFLSMDLKTFEHQLRLCGYEPIGICRNMPFNTHKNKQLAFVYQFMDEVYWCHLPERCWILFLLESYGSKGLEKIEQLTGQKLLA